MEHLKQPIKKSWIPCIVGILLIISCSKDPLSMAMNDYSNLPYLFLYASVFRPFPSVLTTAPADAATDVNVNTTISVTFSEIMNASTISAQATDGACTGSVRVSSDDFATCIGGTLNNSANPTIVFTPSANLSNCTSYKIRIMNTVRSASGTALASVYTQTTGFSTVQETTWTEYTGNPMFGGPTSGTNRAYFPSVLKVGSTYHIWYGTGSSIKHKTSSTPYFDSSIPASAVITFGYKPNAFYKADGWSNVSASCSGKNFLLYTSNNAFTTIDAFCSSDGDTWTDLGAVTGINSCPDVSPTKYTLFVIYDEIAGTFKGYADSGTSEISYHTSTNGLAWTCVQRDITQINDDQGWDSYHNHIAPFVVKKTDGSYMIFYSSGKVAENEGVGYATTISSNGYSGYVKYISNPILSITPVPPAVTPAWRINRSYTTSILHDGNIWYFYFSGRDALGNYSIGVMSKCGDLF